MDCSKPATSGSGTAAGSRTKTSGISPSTRLQRNQAEKERRDKLNGFISELATLVPMVSNASKPLDKVSILRLAAAEMRLHFSCLNPKKYKKKPLVLPPAITASLDLIEKTIGGFIMVTTLTGLIVFCSRSIEDYLGYQNIDVMGNKIAKYIYEDDIKYFESQVNSVVKSLKKARKKTKVIKTHMLQKPLPRSTETCRPRNMIFKISVHQNDTSENGSNNNGSSNLSSHVGKTRPQKDFGYSAVVLLFIEPVRFEPEIDITYIDSNQDVYFTRHGLQGEIIYADQRISTITGYMPHDVQGTSAYQYICSSDVPIALFAQKAMFTSTDGKGVIVYRLRIRDMRFIYLQSSGQIAYKESSNEISHFVCFNRLLSEDEGSQELKKFQQRYAPQIMEAKMLQMKQNPGSTSPTIDLAFEQVMSLIKYANKTDIASTSTKTDSLTSSTISCPEASPGINDQNKAKTAVLPSSFSMEHNFEHSSKDHSVPAPTNNDPSSSVPVNCTPAYINTDNKNAILEKPEQRIGGGPLRRTDCSSTISSTPYTVVTNGRQHKVIVPEHRRNGVNKADPQVVNETFSHPVNDLNTNGTYRMHENSQLISIKSQNGTVHFVNVNNNLINCANLNGTDEIHINQSMVFDPALSQKLTFQLPATTPTLNGQNNNSLMIDVSGQLCDYLQCNEEVPENEHLYESVETVPNILYDQLNVCEEKNPINQIPHSDDKSDISQLYDTSSVSSLLKNSSVSVLSDLYNGVDYNHNLNAYPSFDGYNNYPLPSSISSSYGDSANVSAYSDPGNLNSKLYSTNEMNGYHETAASLDEIKMISPVETFDLMNLSAEINPFKIVPQNTVHHTADITDAKISGTVNAKTMTPVSLSVFPENNGHNPAVSIDWNEISTDPVVREEVPLNKELYSELESFFINFPHLSASEASAVLKGISDIPLSNGNYSSNSISSENKTIYHQ